MPNWGLIGDSDQALLEADILCAKGAWIREGC